VLTIPRRHRHYLARSLYLLMLWVLALTTWQAMFGWGRAISQGDLAYFGTLLFQGLSLLQLLLVLFFSALFAASAITQEKDRRTFVLLLITDLRNYEIVLGKLFGSLLHIGALVVSAVPVLALIMLLGGVAFPQILLALLVLAASALAAGSLGCLLALWREKTFQTLALTVLSLVLYHIVIEGLGLLPSLLSWRDRLQPFRALLSVIEPGVHEGWGRTTAFSFAALMTLLAVLLNGWSIWKLRVWNPSNEPFQPREAPEEGTGTEAARPVDVHAAPGKARAIWSNPVLWREIQTRGYGRRPLLVKAAYLLVVGLIGIWVYQTIPAAAAANYLMPAWGLVPVVVLSFLLLNAQAVTSITTERDLKSLELLLVTDLSPQEFIFGKLGGIFYNCKEIVLPPLLLVGVYAAWGYVSLETSLFLLIALLVLLAFTAMLGLHVALHTVNTRLAIGYSLGTVFFLFIGTLICIYIIIVSGRFEAQWTSFIFFLAVGIGGLWLVLGSNRPAMAISIASWVCPLGIFYTVTNILIGNPQTGQAGDALMPFLVISSAFGFTVAAMLVPVLSEFEVALGYTAPAEE
jgi:ABC-type Na+ efflux pump permease subunit